MTPASFWSWAGRFESYLVENPEDRFSHDEVQLIQALSYRKPWQVRKANYLGVGRWPQNTFYLSLKYDIELSNKK